MRIQALASNPHAYTHEGDLYSYDSTTSTTDTYTHRTGDIVYSGTTYEYQGTAGLDYGSSEAIIQLMKH